MLIIPPIFSKTDLIFQGDTLYFVENDSIIDARFISGSIQETELGRVVHEEQVKISNTRAYFLLYQEKRYSDQDSILTSCTLYSGDHKKLWEISFASNRKIFFDLTRIYGDTIVLVTTNTDNTHPGLELIIKGESQTIIPTHDWDRIINYEFSPNMNYFVAHVKNPHHNRMWDFIYYRNLKNNSSWEYLFPTCLSCKRYRITLKINDTGEAEVISKQQHRVFNKQGKLIDYFIAP